MTKGFHSLKEVLQKSIGFYIRYFFVLLATVMWVALPLSALFVLIFYLGFNERTVFILMSVFVFVLYLCIHLLNLTLLRVIYFLDQEKKVNILQAYAYGFEKFFSWITGIILLLFVIHGLGRSSFFLPSYNFLFLWFLYFFYMAYMIDEKKGRNAFSHVRTLLKNTGKAQVGALVSLLAVLLIPFLLVKSMANQIYDTSLLENLFSYLSLVSGVNLLGVMVAAFPVVYFYFLYKDFSLAREAS